MKYFSHALIAAANGWLDDSAAKTARAERAFADAVSAYQAELDGLRSRVSKTAWEFFRHGSGERGLHDAQLISFAIGDGLSYALDGSFPFRLGRQAAEARIVFLNHEQTYSHEFRARGIRRSTLAFEADDFYSTRRLGDLYACELTSADENHLGLGFVFADGAEIYLEFRNLVYRRTSLHPTYEHDEVHG